MQMCLMILIRAGGTGATFMICGGLTLDLPFLFELFPILVSILRLGSASHLVLVIQSFGGPAARCRRLSSCQAVMMPLWGVGVLWARASVHRRGR